MRAADEFRSSIDYAALGDRLRAYRVGASLQAEDVAAKLGVSRAAVYRMEKGEIVKIEMLERLADLLGTSLAALLGVRVEYYANALGLFERMRQLEHVSDRIFVHFEPISLLLTSDDYQQHLRDMLLEATPHQVGGALKQSQVDELMDIIARRKASFQARSPHVVSLIGMRGLERFLQIGLVGRMKLPGAVRTHRLQAARREVGRIAELMASEPLNVQIGLVDDAMPASTFEFFSGPHQKIVAVSPFRLGELPNVGNGIATVSAAPEAVRMYESLIARLWKGAYKGRAGARHLKKLLEKF